jgi:hypothetical protein
VAGDRAAAPRRGPGARRERRLSEFVGCTVATRRYLGQARVVAESYLEHHPDGRFAVLIPDDPDGERSVDPRVEELRPADVGIDAAEEARLALAYSPRELACAMKGRLARHLVDRGDTAVVLDGDLRVYGSLDPLADAVKPTGLALTTHYVTPHGTPDHYPPLIGWAPRRVNAFGPDQMAIQTGTYNTGVLAVDAGAVAFLDWWNARTARYGLMAPARALFQEQGWSALAPVLFDAHVLRDPVWNASGFSLHDGDVEWAGDRPLLGGEPIRCFHFITFDPEVPDELSRFDHIRGVWPEPDERPGAMRLCRDYADALAAAGFDEAMADTSPYDTLPDGTEIDPNMRTAYLEALLGFEAGEGPEPPNPFLDGEAEAFLGWLDEPWESSGGVPSVSRYLIGLHTRFDWVYGSFKEVPGEDSERLLRWLPDAVDRGDIEIPERWVPAREALPPAPNPPLEELQRQYRDLLQTLESLRTSRSWRATEPLRRAAARARRRH